MMLYQMGKISLCVALFANAMAFTVIFPFASLLVQKMGMAEDRTETGFWVGLLSFSMMAGRFLSSPVWGWITDRFGRRPANLMGSLTIIILNLMFGFSPNYWLVVSVRFLLGALCCISLVCTAQMIELTNSDPQSMAWTVISWQLGHTCGNIVGGVFVDPASTGLANWELFEDYPFLMPNLIVCAFALISLALNYFFVRESVSASVDISGKNYKEMLSDSKVLWQLLIYFAWIVVDIGYQEIISLYCWAEKKDGGFGMSPTEIGNILGISAVILIIFEMPIYNFLTKYYDIVTLSQRVTLAGFVFMVLVPLCTFLQDMVYVKYLVIGFSSFSWWMLSFVIVTNMVIMQNNCVKDSERGKMNGMAIAASSIAKAVSPLFLGTVFAYTAKSELPYPLNYAFAFNLMAVFSLGCYFVTLSRHLKGLEKPLEDIDRYEPLD